MRRWTWVVLGGCVLAAPLTGQAPVPVPKPQDKPAFIPLPPPPLPLPVPGAIQIGIMPGPVPVAPPAVSDALPEGAIARLGILRSRVQGGPIPTALAYSPDGKLLASTGDRVVRLWDAVTGRELRLLGDGRVAFAGQTSLAFAPDGKLLAASVANLVKVWEVTSGREVANWQSPTGSAAALDFSPDGKHLAGLRGLDPATRRPLAAIWDPVTGQEVQHFPVGQPGVYSSIAWLAYAPDGRSLAVATIGRPIHLVETATGQVRAELTVTRPGPAVGTTMSGAVAFAPDGRTLYVVTPEGAIAVWDVTAGKERQRFGTAAINSPLALSADGKVLAVRANDNSLRLYEPSAGRFRHRLADPSGMPLANAFALAPDGATVAAMGTGGLRFWDTATGRERGPAEGHTTPVTGLAFTPDGSSLVSVSAEKVSAWNLATRKPRSVLNEPASNQRPRLLSPDGRRLAVLGAASSVRVVEVPDGKVVRQLDEIASGPYGLAFTLDSNTLAVSEGRAVKLWDLSDGRAKRTIETAGGSVVQLAFAPDGRRLAGVGGFGGVQVWETDTGQRLWEQAVPAVSGRAPLVFSPDGRRLAYGGSDGLVRVHDTATGEAVTTLEGHTGAVHAVAFSTDGQELATGGADRQVRVWEAATGRLLHTLAGHHGAVESLDYSPDGKLLASGGSDTVVVLWDATRLGPKAERAAAEPELTDEQMNKLWDDLADADAAKAFQAMRELAAAPRSAAAQLRPRLRPVEPADPQKVGPLLVDLDSQRFDRREKATRALAGLGEGARGALVKFLADSTSTEARLRAQEVMKALDQLGRSPELLRQMRAVEVLERVGTPEARAALEDLAKGLDVARLTVEARASLERLRKQDGERRP